MRHIRDNNFDSNDPNNFNCQECPFHTFMLFFNVFVNHSNCNMNCTENNKNNINELYSSLVKDMIIVRNTGTVCYIRNLNEKINKGDDIE